MRIYAYVWCVSLSCVFCLLLFVVVCWDGVRLSLWGVFLILLFGVGYCYLVFFVCCLGLICGFNWICIE